MSYSFRHWMTPRRLNGHGFAYYLHSSHVPNEIALMTERRAAAPWQEGLSGSEFYDPDGQLVSVYGDAMQALGGGWYAIRGYAHPVFNTVSALVAQMQSEPGRVTLSGSPYATLHDALVAGEDPLRILAAAGAPQALADWERRRQSILGGGSSQSIRPGLAVAGILALGALAMRRRR